MRVRFWGTRGSIATPGEGTNKYGGNTSCVEVRCEQDLIVLDAGTGIRPLGQHLMKEASGRPITAHIFIGHTHWDHIQGFPFFIPAYLKGNRFALYGSSGVDTDFYQLIQGQMKQDYFPVNLGDMASELSFVEMSGQTVSIGNSRVDTIYLNHPGLALGFRVRHGGRTLVYCSDHEPFHKTIRSIKGEIPDDQRSYVQGLDRALVEFARGADLFVCDSQYTEEEYRTHVHWGHSSIDDTLAAAHAAAVVRYAVYHHDPYHDDAFVDGMVSYAQNRLRELGSRVECFGAREGSSLDL
ncbi:MAG: MBL fold metallo-hydrolase [Planctomycetes bacterium]|nr:MBL fold metallo-hydrolase [Planctomycetota bacterium]